jgi:hypothetical protein
LLLDSVQKPFISKMGVALLIILHMLTNGSRALMKRKRQDLAEDGTLGKIKKRRDAGIKRGHKEGSLPHFLREQSSQRAGEQLEEPAEFDSHVRDALENCPDDPLNSAQKKLEKNARRNVTKVLERHEEMIKAESEKMKKKLDKYEQKEQKVEAKSWCQQMSFDSQQKADRFLNLAETRWMAEEKEDRDTIRKFCKAVSNEVEKFLLPLKGHAIWCVENTDVFHGGLTSDTFKKALRNQRVLFAAVLFGGYVVDRTWLKKAEEVFQISETVVEPHWRLKGAVCKPLELFVHSNFGEQEEFKEFGSIIEAANSDRWIVHQKSIENGSLLSHWTIRDFRRQIRKAKQGLVLFGSKEKAKENVKKLKTMRKEIRLQKRQVKQLRERVPRPRLRLAALTQKVMNAQKLMNAQKGSPVGPKSFFKKIANMVELRKHG